MNSQNKFRVWNGTEMVYDVMVGKFGTFYVNPMAKGDVLNDKDTASLSPFNTKYPDNTPTMQFIGHQDKNGKDIYSGDILELVDSIGRKIQVICEFGDYERQLRNFVGDIHNCQITGFAFLVNNRYPTFPIIKNYLGVCDLEIMEVIGNIYQTKTK